MRRTLLTAVLVAAIAMSGSAVPAETTETPAADALSTDCH